MPIKEQIVYTLRRVRSPIANYQEDKRGVPKAEPYSFMDLLSALCSHAYATLTTVAAMLFNVLPLLEGFLYIIRFILDRLLSIIEAESIVEKVTMSLLLTGQLIVLGILVYFILTLLLLPLLHFSYTIIVKIFNVSTGKK